MADEKIDVKVKLGLDSTSEQQVKKDVSRVTKELENQVNYEKQRKQVINNIAKELNTTSSIIEKSLKLTERERKEHEKVLQLSKKNEISEKKQLEDLELKIRLFKELQTRNITSLQSGNLKGLYDKSALDSFQKSLSELSINTPDLEKKMKLLGSEFKNIKNGAQNSSKAISVASKETASFATGIKDAAIKFGLWSAVTVAYYGAIRAIGEGIDTIRELDTALVELKKVTDETDVTYQKFTDTAFQMAEATGSSGVDAIKATSAFARMNFTLEESIKLGEKALILQNIGDGINTIEEATTSLVAIMKGFELQAKDSEHVIDGLNEVSNRFAVNTSQLSNGLMRISATSNQSNNSLDETIGLMTGAVEILQNWEKASSGINVLTQRIRGVSEEGENLLPTLQKTFDSLKLISGETVRIPIEDANGDLRSTYEILQDLSKIYPNLESKTKQYVGSLVAGKRQITVLEAILQNFENVEKATQASIDSAGSARVEQEKYLDSIEGKMKILDKTTQEFWSHFISSDTVKSTIEAFTKFIEIFDRLTQSIGETNTVLLALTLAILIFKKEALIGGIKALYNFSLNLLGIATSAEIAAGAVNGFNLSASGLTFGLSLLIPMILQIIDSNKKLETSLQDTNTEIEKQIDNFDNLTEKEKELLELRLRNKLIDEGYSNKSDVEKRIDDINQELIRFEKISQKFSKIGETGKESEYNRRIENRQKELDKLHEIMKTFELLEKVEMHESNKLTNAYTNQRDALNSLKDKVSDTSDEIEELTDKEKEHQEMMQFSIEQLDTLAQKYPEYSEKVIEYQIKETEAVIIEAQKRLSAMEIESSAIDRVMQKYYGMKGVADDATLNMSRAILNTINSGTFKDVIDTSALDGAKKDLQDLLDLQEKYFGKDKKSSSKTKEATAYYKELAKIAEIENKIAILKTKQSLTDNEREKIKLIRQQVEETKNLQEAQHVLNEARRRDLANLKVGSEEYTKLEKSIESTSGAWWTAQKAIQDYNKEIDNLIKEIRDDIKETDKELAKIIEERRIENFNNQIKITVENIKDFADELNNASKYADNLLSVGDLEGGFEALTKQLNSQLQVTNELNREYATLQTLIQQAQSSEEKSKLADNMEKVSDSITTAQLNAQKLVTEIGKLKIDVISKHFGDITSEIEEQINLLDSQLVPLMEGFLSGLDIDLGENFIGNQLDFGGLQDAFKNIFDNEKNRIEEINSLRREANSQEISETKASYNKEIQDLMNHRADLERRLMLSYGAEENLATQHYQKMLDFVVQFANGSEEALQSMLSATGNLGGSVSSGNYSSANQNVLNDYYQRFPNSLIPPEIILQANTNSMQPKGMQLNVPSQLKSTSSDINDYMDETGAVIFEKIMELVEKHGIDDKFYEKIFGYSGTETNPFVDFDDDALEGDFYAIAKNIQSYLVNSTSKNLEETINNWIDNIFKTNLFTGVSHNRLDKDYLVKRLFGERVDKGTGGEVLESKGLSAVQGKLASEYGFSVESAKNLLGTDFREIEDVGDLLRNFTAWTKSIQDLSIDERVAELNLAKQTTGEIVNEMQQLQMNLPKFEFDFDMKEYQSNIKDIQDGLQNTFEEIRVSGKSVEEQLLAINEVSKNASIKISEQQIELNQALINSQNEYIKALEEEYLANEDNAELQAIIQSKLNDAYNQRLSYEQQLRNSIKQRYETEFKFMDKELSMIESTNSLREKELKLAELRGETADLDSNTLANEKEKQNLLKENVETLESQMAQLEVGSFEWNLLNEQLLKYKNSLLDSEIAVEEINNKLKEQEIDRINDELDEELRIYKELKNAQIKRLEAMKKGNTEADKEAEFIEKIADAEQKVLNIREKLANLRKERNIKVFTGKGFEFQANQKEIKNTTLELQEANKDLSESRKEFDTYKFNRDIDLRIQAIEKEIQKEENNVLALKKLAEVGKITNDMYKEGAEIITGNLVPANELLIDTLELTGQKLLDNIEKFKDMENIFGRIGNLSDISISNSPAVIPIPSRIGGSEGMYKGDNIVIKNIDVKHPNADFNDVIKEVHNKVTIYKHK